MTDREPIPQGTLDILVLSTLDREVELHGFEIAEEIGRRSGNVLEVEEGSLYPALQRLLVNGMIRGRWGRTSENRRARYYTVTAEGRRALEEKLARYRRVSVAIAAVLKPA
jgi:PadR family transcriptional regulator, regulatory protein PadR